MILSDRDLRAEIESGRVVIEPYDESAIQPSSIDLRAGDEFLVFVNHRYPHIDVRQPLDQLTEPVKATPDEPFILHPGEFVLGSTLETVTLPNNLVARLEGKSSLGRLGLLIHSSLPGDEPVLFFHEGELQELPIETIVNKRLAGKVVSFDPETFEVGYHDVTGWHETAPDRIFEVILASGRKVRLTGAHSLFTLDAAGELAKVRVAQLTEGSFVAIPGVIDDPSPSRPFIDLVLLAPESEYADLVCGGGGVDRAFEEGPEELREMLSEIGIGHFDYYARKRQLPVSIAMQDGDIALGIEWMAARGGSHRLPTVIEINEGLAWLIGLYVAEGSRRQGQITISNTDQGTLDRAQAVLAALGLPVTRSPVAITCCSALLSRAVRWMGMGGYATEKRVPSAVFGWPQHLLKSFLDGFIEGDGSREPTRVSLWTSSDELAMDLLLICVRLGKRASAQLRATEEHYLWQVSVPHREHKLLTTAPHVRQLLLDLRAGTGMNQKEAAAAIGFRYNTQLNNVERGGGDALRISTLRRIRDAYAEATARDPRLDRIVDGDLRWDRIKEVRDTGRVETVYDLSVRPGGKRIENFIAGRGGVFVSNTAGFVDAGFSGQLTLELSNVATLPIAIYPGMKIGQLCLFQMSSPAERPYGSSDVGSKYQGQTGPTPSRYFKNFED